MVKDDSDRLSVLRQELRKRLGNERYELWLGPETELALVDGVLEVRCLSQAETLWLRRRLHEALLECGALAFGATPAVAYVAVEQPPGKATSEALGAAESAAIGAAALPVQPAASEPCGTAASPTASNTRARGTFDDFVCGPANLAAVQAARDVAQQPGRFSPLLLHGSVGSGKSHLLQAIGHYARGPQRSARALLLTAEQFTSQFLEALERRLLPGFRQKMRSLEMLLIDDVQFLGGKKATMEELLYTIDALTAHGGQIVLASSLAAVELQAVSPGLASRISGGLSVQLDQPDYATRTGIVRSMAARMQIPLEAAVINLIAERVAGSGRLLSGAINRLVAASMALKKRITVELAAPVLEDFCRQHAPQVKLVDIQRAVCDVFGVDWTSLKSQRKNRSIAEPRMLAMWLARRYTRAPLSEIGDFFGRRSHSTVVSAQRKFDRLISSHGEIVVGDQGCPVEEAIRRIEARLRTG